MISHARCFLFALLPVEDFYYKYFCLAYVYIRKLKKTVQGRNANLSLECKTRHFQVHFFRNTLHLRPIWGMKRDLPTRGVLSVVGRGATVRASNQAWWNSRWCNLVQKCSRVSFSGMSGTLPFRMLTWSLILEAERTRPGIANLMTSSVTSRILVSSLRGWSAHEAHQVRSWARMA